MRVGLVSSWLSSFRLAQYIVQKPLLSLSRRGFSFTPHRHAGLDDDARALLTKTRNIGIIAHIDAV